MIIVNDIIKEQIKNYLDVYSESQFLFTINKQLDKNEDLQNRKNNNGHVTSSIILLNESKDKILMIHHNFLQKFLQPGGHYEENVPVSVSALRELNEETGYPLDKVIKLYDQYPIDIDTHWIPDQPAKHEKAHCHHDFAYVALGDENVELVPQLEEVTQPQWISINELLEGDESRIKRIIAKLNNFDFKDS